jgi:hypothetical protein
MREIIFRGKVDFRIPVMDEYRPVKDRRWYYGFLACGNAVSFDHTLTYVVPETVGQYTGLKDKNGEKIFEGDILECERHIPDTNFKKEKFRHVVHFDNGVLYALQEFLFEKTIIGNIHDNPDLLDRNKVEEEER